MLASNLQCNSPQVMTRIPYHLHRCDSCTVEARQHRKTVTVLGLDAG